MVTKETINKRINKTQIYSADDLIKHYERKTSGHFFSPDTMRFFKSRLSQDLFYTSKTVLFITSEQNTGYPRLYTLREYNPNTGEIDQIGEFQGFNTLAQAKRYAQKLIKDEGI